MLDAYCEFHRTDRGHDERNEEERYAQGKGATMEIWVATRDARNRDVRVLFSAAIRFQKAFEDRQILVQYRGVLSNWTTHGSPI